MRIPSVTGVNECMVDEANPGLLTVELGSRVRSGSGSKGHWEIGGAHGVIEDARPPGTIVIECLVHDIPSIAFALVVTNLAGDVCLDGGGESAVCPCAGGQPVWQLIVPDECMAPQNLPVRRREVRDDISLGVAVRILRGFRIYAVLVTFLHSVLKTILSQGVIQNFE